MTDIMEARRKGFEEIYEIPEGAEFNGKFYMGGVNVTGLTMANIRWESWNAALDSVCVELPPILCVPEDCDDPSAYDCYNYGINNCRSAIERAGLKVKP